MMTVTVEISDEKLREIIAHYIRDLYDGDCRPEDIKFLVSYGYNGEMGGRTTPSTCKVVYKREV